MRHARIWLLLTLAPLLLCARDYDPFAHEPEEEELRFTGTVRHVEMDGGFYGLVSDRGERYEPMYLEEYYRVDGLRVSVEARLRADEPSRHLWGRVIEILYIRRLEDREPPPAPPRPIP